MTVIVSCVPRENWCTITGYAQGGTYAVKADLSQSDIRPRELKDSVEAILSAIDKSVSGYNKGSLLCRLNAGERIRPDGILMDLYRKSYQIYCSTDAYVDVASAPLYDIWGFGFKSGEFPSDETVAKTIASSGMDRLVPDMQAVLDSNGMLDAHDLLLPGKGSALPKLNFNAVAQGYTCDLVAAYLHSLGVKDMLVDIGEIYCEGVNAKGNFWKVGVDRPVDGNMTPGADLDGIWQGDGRGCGIVTSGNYRKYYEKDGKKYSHTIDPRTGYPVSHSLLSATIVTGNAADADAYATYCMVIGLEEAKAFISSAPDVEGYLIYDQDGQMKEWASEGFNIVSPEQ